MIKNKIKLGFLGTSVLLALVSCSKDDSSTNSNENEKSGVLSNDELTLTYGKSLLSHFVESKNSQITFDRINGSETFSRTIFSVTAYNPDLTGFTAISGSQNVNFDNGEKYYIAAGTTFSGNMNFNNGTLIVLGNLSTNGTINVGNNSKIIVGSSATFGANTKIHLNSNGILDNYGNYTYRTQTVDGTINNYNTLTFNDTDLVINSNGTVNNNCKVYLKRKADINGNFNNNAYAIFEGGFHMNSSGRINVKPGTLTEISGGHITVQGKVINASSTGFARFDLTGSATIFDLNSNPSFEGKIDINSNFTIAASKINADVTLNKNIYIAGDDCVPQRGTAPAAACNDNTLNFTLAANAISPTVKGASLSATDVKIENGFAYVSYHNNDQVNGDAPNGSIRVFNIQNAGTPSLVAQADFNNAEFNGIDVNNNMLYAVGGNKAGARMFTATLNQGTFNADLSTFNPFKLPSTTAKNSYVENNTVWLASGNTNGGLFKLNASDKYSSTTAFAKTGAKYVAHNATKQAFFAVETGGAFLRIAGLDGTGAVEYTYPNLVQTIKDGKNAIAMDNDYVYVALSDKGVAKFSLSNGAMVSHFVPNDFRVDGNKIFKQNGYSNAVTVDACYLYVANGADGVIVLNKDTFNVVGSFKLSESANFVYAKDGYLFVATGRSGLNIIKIN